MRRSYATSIEGEQIDSWPDEDAGRSISMDERLEDKYPEELNMCKELFVFFSFNGERRTDLLRSKLFSDRPGRGYLGRDTLGGREGSITSPLNFIRRGRSSLLDWLEEEDSSSANNALCLWELLDLL